MRSTIYHCGRHVDKHEIYSAERWCPICGYSGSRARLAVIQREPDIHLLHCPSCRGLSASQMPTPSTLDAYYASYYDQQDERLTFYRPDRVAKHIVADLSLENEAGPRIMDIGGGDGSIPLEVARRLLGPSTRQIHIQVVDHVSELPRLEGSISLEFLCQIENADADCDLIIASAIFEHIPELRPILNAVFAKLRPGGFLYARTLMCCLSCAL
jgi:SAM-dependent methyltransferase